MGIAAACATIPVQGDPAVTVTAIAETVPVGTTNEDAADDPAIWRNPADPAASLIVGTDKKGGLYVYNLKGEQLSFLAAPGMNNVDLVELGDGTVVVAASDRSDLANGQIFLALLDRATGNLTPAGKVAVGPGEGYGICIDKPNSGTVAGNRFTVFNAPKNGVIYRTEITRANGAFSGTTTTLATVATQPEGCIADPRTGTLYIGEEDAGLFEELHRYVQARLVAGGAKPKADKNSNSTTASESSTSGSRNGSTTSISEGEATRTTASVPSQHQHPKNRRRNEMDPSDESCSHASMRDR